MAAIAVDSDHLAGSDFCSTEGFLRQRKDIADERGCPVDVIKTTRKDRRRRDQDEEHGNTVKNSGDKPLKAETVVCDSQVTIHSGPY